MAANGFILLLGMSMSILFWIIGCIGFHNVTLFIFLLGMVPPDLIAGGMGSHTEEDGKGDGADMLSSIIHNLVGLFERTPDEEEIVHRKIASAAVMEANLELLDDNDI